MRMITLQAHRYAGRALKPGDEFDAARRDARFLKASGRATVAPPPPPVPPAPARARQVKEDPPPVLAPVLEPALPFDLAVEDPPAPVPAAEPAEPPKPKRTYTRRDLVADE